jgi:hypothetical protein
VLVLVSWRGGAARRAASHPAAGTVSCLAKIPAAMERGLLGGDRAAPSYRVAPRCRRLLLRTEGSTRSLSLSSHARGADDGGRRLRDAR